MSNTEIINIEVDANKALQAISEANAAIKELTDANYLDNWSTLPDWSIFDFLTSLAFTDHKAFFINSPTDQNLLQAVSLKEIAANSAKNWSSKIDIASITRETWNYGFIYIWCVS